jgi:hypothetical protein
MIAKVTQIVIHSGRRLMVNCGNLIIIVWTSLRLRLLVVLKVFFEHTLFKDTYFPTWEGMFLKDYLNFGLNSFRIALGKVLRI